MTAPDSQASAMVILPTQRRSSGLFEQPSNWPRSDVTPRHADDGPLTEYLPSFGHLPDPGPPARPLDLDGERAAALTAALEGQRPDGEHLALLDRVLRGLRRL